MIDPPRLIDDGGDPFEQALLGSARRDHGSAAAQTRCVAAATTAAVATGHTVATAATAVTATKATAAASVGASFVVKAVSIGFAVGLSVQGVVAVKDHVRRAPALQQLDSQPAASSQALVQPRAATAPTTALPHTEPAAEPTAKPPTEHASVPLPNAANVAPRVASSNRAVGAAAISPEYKLLDEPIAEPTFSVKRDDSLDREVALLDEARRFVLAQGFARTLLLLERHQRDFPAGALAPEALVIRVQALLGLGRRAEAEALAERFATVHPNSPVSKRLNALFGNRQ